MTDPYTLITFASWEDRFLDGFRGLVSEFLPSNVLMYYLDGYAEMSYDNRAFVKKLCNEHNIPIFDRELHIDNPAGNWACLHKTLAEHLEQEPRAIVDLSTMPREFIWMIFWFLDFKGVTTEYAYNLPQNYGNWLSRDPQSPRLVYKMSGLSKLGARTVLVILAGYDVERTQHLINFYEPAITLLGLQKQHKDYDAGRLNKYIERFEKDSSVEIFEIDAFTPDHGQSIVENRVLPYLKSYNVIMSSLGPKLSAVALYRIHRAHREIGLAYAPSREFNREYSMGIGEKITGVI